MEYVYGAYRSFLNRHDQLCVLFIVLLITAEVDFRFQSADIQRVSHPRLVLLVVLLQLARSIGLETTEQGHTFLTVAFGGQIWNIPVSYTHLDVYKRQP